MFCIFHSIRFPGHSRKHRALGGTLITFRRHQPAWLWAVPIWLVVALCCALPLGWMVVRVVTQPAGVRNLLPTPFYLALLARTVGYATCVAVIATVLAIPAAIVLGRGRGFISLALWFILPAALLMPSITYAYGWLQFLRIVARQPEWGGGLDVLRCIWTLATWLWPIPAGVLGLSLRRADVDVQQQALLDGALWRLTARQLAGPTAAAMACVIVLASQEFAVYEPTGISVVATEVRMVFETGAFSSPDNPITASFIGGGGAAASAASPSQPDAPDSPDAPARSNEVPTLGTRGLNGQDARAGGAIATSVPLLLTAMVIGTAGIFGVRRVSATSDDLHEGPWPRVLEPSVAFKVLAPLVVIVTLVVPTVSMLLSLQIRRSIPTVWLEFSPQATGSLIIASVTAVLAAVVAFTGAVRRVRGALIMSLAAFLIGGQLLAIALIRLYNRSAPWPLGLVHSGGGGAAGGMRRPIDVFDLVYNGIPIVVMAYLARFAWLALLAGGFTRTRAWRQVRELVALDGATAGQAARHVLWPLAWPVLLASALLVGVLSLTEVPATVLISPLRPQPLIPMLMGWVHMLRYDNMIEGSLLLMSMAFALSLVAAGLIGVGMRILRGIEGKRQKAEGRIALRVLCFCLLPSAFSLLSGCRDGKAPEEVWLETGNSPGQVVYPRAISYSPKDDTFFIIDRLARVQHLTSEGKPLGGWRMPEWRVGRPVGVSVGPDGNVYVPDTHYDRVIVYSPAGKEIRRFGERGDKPGQFIWPTDIAFDKAGNCYVAEYGGHDRIQVFAPDGSYQREFGRFGNGDGEFSRPQSMVIDGEFVYVTDACNHRLIVFKTDGTFVRNMGELGSGLGQFRFPFGLDEDAKGRLIVCEFGNNRLQLVDKETGKGLETWGVPGRDPGQFAYPWAVALDRKGRVVAVDSGNNRVQVFEF